MSVDISLIKPGDQVTVEFTVSAVNLPNGMVYDLDERPFYVGEIVTHTPAPRPIKAGDCVKTAREGIKYRVVAVENDGAWLCDEIGHYWTVLLSTLEHADA